MTGHNCIADIVEKTLGTFSDLLKGLFKNLYKQKETPTFAEKRIIWIFQIT